MNWMEINVTRVRSYFDNDSLRRPSFCTISSLRFIQQKKSDAIFLQLTHWLSFVNQLAGDSWHARISRKFLVTQIV